MSDSTMTYVALCPTCGSMRAASMDTPDNREDTAQSVSRWISGGYEVKRVTMDEYHDLPWSCECGKQQELALEAP